MESRAESLPRGLLVGVLVLTVVVMGLGGALIAVKLRPEAMPTTSVARSLQMWRDAVAANPDDGDLQTGLGLALLRAGQTDEARAAFERALQLNQSDWMARYQLATLVASSDPARAIELFARAAKDAPRMSKAGPLTAEGKLLLAQGDAQAASGAFRRAIADVPYLMDAHLGLARALEALGDTEGALQEYRDALRFDPSNQEIAAAIQRLQSGA
jgi:Flp pilus assembly protein TadD